MTRHLRLQRTLRSKVRHRKRMKNRQTRLLRRRVNTAFDTAIRPHFPPGFDFGTLAVREPDPQERFRALRKAARRARRKAAAS